MRDYDRIAEIIEYISLHHQQQPTLNELADRLGLSPHHFQRLFLRWAGVTPKKFLQCLTVKAAKSQLLSGKSVLDASLAAGLSGPGRLHDLTVTLEGASPGEIKSGGVGWEIVAGFAETPFGSCLIAESPRGICRMEFVERCDTRSAREAIQRDWPSATIVVDNQNARDLAASVFATPGEPGRTNKLSCLVKGTKFQTKVWRALLCVPFGQVTTYGRIASAIGKPAASRAVGTAIGANSIAYLIPCHRVIRESGVISEYRWGSFRKTAMLGNERCRRNSNSSAPFLVEP